MRLPCGTTTDWVKLPGAREMGVKVWAWIPV